MILEDFATKIIEQAKNGASVSDVMQLLSEWKGKDEKMTNFKALHNIVENGAFVTLERRLSTVSKIKGVEGGGKFTFPFVFENNDVFRSIAKSIVRNENKYLVFAVVADYEAYLKEFA